MLCQVCQRGGLEFHGKVETEPDKIFPKGSERREKAVSGSRISARPNNKSTLGWRQWAACGLPGGQSRGPMREKFLARRGGRNGGFWGSILNLPKRGIGLASRFLRNGRAPLVLVTLWALYTFSPPSLTHTSDRLGPRRVVGPQRARPLSRAASPAGWTGWVRATLGRRCEGWERTLAPSMVAPVDLFAAARCWKTAAVCNDGFARITAVL